MAHSRLHNRFLADIRTRIRATSPARYARTFETHSFAIEGTTRLHQTTEYANTGKGKSKHRRRQCRARIVLKEVAVPSVRVRLVN